jgi:ketosteroid isomerase-like protein
LPPAERAVLDANNRFYQALSDQDLDAMEAIWLPTEWAQCVHPGWSVLHGWKAIRESWAGILRNPATLSITIDDVHVRVAGDVAWVTCTERVSALSSNQLDTSLAQATNVFVALGGGWRLVVHHASAVALAEPGAWAADSESVH